VTTWKRVLSALFLILAIGLPARAEDKWYELYQGALKSISSRKWPDAEKKLKAAMASGPTPGRQVRMYGVRFIDYLPEYHLGLVYFNQQRYADALEQFAKAQASGQVTKGDVEFATLTDMVELCRIRTAGSRPDGQKESEALVRFARELMGRGSLEDARRALDTAAAKTPGAPEVTSAREELVRLETEKRMRAAQETVRASPTPEPAPPSPGPSPRAPSPAPSAKASPEPAANALAVRERGAFQAFYSGDYGAAADRFEALAETARRLQRERFVAYAAFSRAGAALLRGRDGDGELLRARRLYAEAGATASRVVASDGFVPPGIVRALREPAAR
jgi:TolA-binding protein